MQNQNSIRDQITKCAETAAREGWDVIDESPTLRCPEATTTAPAIARAVQ